MRNKIALLLGLTLLLTACGGGASLSIEDAWVRPALAGNNAAIYLVIDNGAQSDTLLSVESDRAAAVELHQSMMVEVDELDGMVEGAHEDAGDAMDGDEMMMDGGVMQMVLLDSVEVGANQQTVFEPGGLHMMLVNVHGDLVAGDSFEITLDFEHAGELRVTVHIDDR